VNVCAIRVHFELHFIVANARMQRVCTTPKVTPRSDFLAFRYYRRRHLSTSHKHGRNDMSTMRPSSRTVASDLGESWAMSEDSEHSEYFGICYLVLDPVLTALQSTRRWTTRKMLWHFRLKCNPILSFDHSTCQTLQHPAGASISSPSSKALRRSILKDAASPLALHGRRILGYSATNRGRTGQHENGTFTNSGSRSDLLLPTLCSRPGY